MLRSFFFLIVVAIVALFLFGQTGSGGRAGVAGGAAVQAGAAGAAGDGDRRPEPPSGGGMREAAGGPGALARSEQRTPEGTDPGLAGGTPKTTNNQPENYPIYSSPLRGEPLITGTFGELRANHFHAGLDLRGAVGTPVYAVGAGHVSRIKIQAGGYGQAIYVRHPEGYSSVYAHLDRLTEPLMDYVRSAQYQREEFAVDLRPDPARFPVARGEQIGVVGDRGYSFGPHLHFEMRGDDEDEALNPLLFGIRVADTKAPDIREVLLYEMDESGRKVGEQNLKLWAGGPNRKRVADTVYTSAPLVGLELKAYDKQDKLNNWNGIYSVRLFADRDSVARFGYRFSKVHYEDTRYLNSHVDYAAYSLRNTWFHRVFRQPGNLLRLYQGASNGTLPLAVDQYRDLLLEVGDYAGNTASARLTVKRRPAPAGELLPAPPPYQYFLPWGEASLIDDGRVRLLFPAGTIYENLYLNYQTVEDRSESVFSVVAQVHRAGVPLHKYAEIALTPADNLPEYLRAKAVVARCRPGGGYVSYGGNWRSDGRLHSEFRDFGDYCITIDTVAPTIQAETFRENLRGAAGFSFKLRDNMPTSGPAGDLRYRALVDGRWVLLEYDLKNARLFHEFDGSIPAGRHELVIEATDDRGNTGRFVGAFVR